MDKMQVCVGHASAFHCSFGNGGMEVMPHRMARFIHEYRALKPRGQASVERYVEAISKVQADELRKAVSL